MAAKTEQRPAGLGHFLKGHAGRIIIWLVSLGFLAVPVWLLADNYVDSAGVETLPYAASLGAPRYNYFGSPAEVYSPADNSQPIDLCVTFEFLGVDETSPQANFGILIDITSTGEWDLEHQLPQKHPPKRGTLLIASNSGLSSISIPLSLSQLENLPPSDMANCDNVNSSQQASRLDYFAEVRIRQGIFLLGTPRAFPNDWYELNDDVSVSIPGVTLYTALVITSRDEDYALAASMYTTGGTGNAGVDALEFTIRRPLLFIIYTYIVAATPFVLLIAVFAIKYCRKPPKLPEPYEVAFGIGATLVAILPLRSVLIPSSLPSPTRLDIYFGLGAVFLVAASVIWMVSIRIHTEATDGGTSGGGKGADGTGGGTG
jgi:hypothetical protein